MKTIDKSEITDNFLEILEQIQSEGEEVLVTEDSQPILKISPYQKSPNNSRAIWGTEGKSSVF